MTEMEMEKYFVKWKKNKKKWKLPVEPERVQEALHHIHAEQNHKRDRSKADELNENLMLV